ncbi:hypothetical protein K2173_002234 [Erythroxylum novogranatense]|uniref:Phytocyanin domain-containing protein n=1 Tax=Erythroxylum novogranatense TaxID=1862640 RepID=A0AAV8TAJ3_9ROSI|nr:hypothetical protein K2173_002234 [Erythroxylum novogranatense]
MGLTYARIMVFVLGASLMTTSVANPQWQYGFNYSDGGNRHGFNRPKYDDPPRKIVVGGSNNWQFGINYFKWALNNGPFFVNDTLVFKYNPPSENNTHPHSVYLLPNLWSFMRCDMSRGKMIANTTQGSGDGFEFVLKFQPHYFACGASNGFHCNNGTMKFFIMPMLRL